MRDHDALDNNPLVSRNALELLHEELYGWSLSRTGYDRSAAEDLMQQAYVELLSGRARYDAKSSLKTFVFAVVQTLGRSRFRKLATTLRVVNKFATNTDVPAALSVDIDNAPTRLVWSAVQALPARQRDIIELVFCREMTIEEASSVMGVSMGTGRVHYDRAKKALALALADLQADIEMAGDQYA